MVERIFAALRLEPCDHVVEVGPGNGVLTRRLQREAGSVAAVEVDRQLAARLREELPAVNTIAGDVLKTDLASLAAAGQGRCRVVGNLPYNIATPLLGRLFAASRHIADIHVMLQTEVATRLTAAHGSRAYGRLSVMAQYHCDIEPLFDVEAASFSPPPKVSSTFVRLVPRPGDGCDPLALDRVLRVCFAQRRKQLRKALASLRIEPAELAIDATARAETLSVADYVALANAAGGQRPAPRPSEAPAG